MNTQLKTLENKRKIRQEADINQIQKKAQLSNNELAKLLNKVDKLEQIKISNTVTLYSNNGLQAEIKRQNNNQWNQKRVNLKDDRYYLVSEGKVTAYPVNDVKTLQANLNEVVIFTKTYYHTINKMMTKIHNRV